MTGTNRWPQQARGSGLRAEASRREVTRRGWRLLIGLLPMLAAVACGSTLATTGTLQGHTYRDSAGLTIKIPQGWNARQFSDAKDGITSAGVQLSNVQLPQPSLAPGFPIQVNNKVLPAHGIGLIVATDTDHAVSHYGRLAAPPLPGPDTRNAWRYWDAGSQPAGTPEIKILWFRAHGTIFVATAKIGSKATKSGLDALDAIVQSLR